MSGLNWDLSRHEDGSIALVAAFRRAYPDDDASFRHVADAENFLREVMYLQPIQSRQLAALALASAREIAT